MENNSFRVKGSKTRAATSSDIEAEESLFQPADAITKRQDFQSEPIAEVLHQLRGAVSNLEDLSLRRYISKNILASSSRSSQTENRELSDAIDKYTSEKFTSKKSEEQRIRDVMKMFHEHPSFAKNNVESLHPENGRFIKYILNRLNSEEVSFKAFVVDAFSILYEASLSKNEAKREAFFLEYPPQEKDLNCLGGVGSRGEDVLRRLQSNQAQSMFTDAHQSVMSKFTEMTKEFFLKIRENPEEVYNNYQVHIPAYIIYLLSLRSSEEIKKADNNYLLPGRVIPREFVIKVYQQYSTRIKEYIGDKYLNEKDLRSSIKMELDEIVIAEEKAKELESGFFKKDFAVRFDENENGVDEENAVHFAVISNIEKELRGKFPEIEEEFNVFKSVIEKGTLESSAEQKDASVDASSLYHFNQDEIVDKILRNRLENFRDELKTIASQKLSNIAKFPPLPPILNPSAKKSIGQIIVAKFESDNPQELLEGLEMLWAIAARMNGRAHEDETGYFYDIIVNNGILKHGAKVVRLLPESEWKFKHIKAMLFTVRSELWCTAIQYLREDNPRDLDALIKSRGSEEWEALRVRTMTIFHQAVLENRIDAVKILLQNENAKKMLEVRMELVINDSTCGRTPIELAAMQGNLEIIKLFLQNGALPFSLTSTIKIAPRDIGEYLANIKSKRVTLHEAIKSNPNSINVAWLDLLSANKEDLSCIINSQGTKKETALNNAVLKLCDASVINALIDRGADAAIQNKKNENAITLALKGKNINALQVFVGRDAGRQKSDDTIQQILTYLVEHDDLKFLAPLHQALNDESKAKLSLKLTQWVEVEKDNLSVGVFRAISKISESLKNNTLLQDSAADIKDQEAPKKSRFSFLKASRGPAPAAEEDHVSKEEYLTQIKESLLVSKNSGKVTSAKASSLTDKKYVRETLV